MSSFELYRFLKKYNSYDSKNHMKSYNTTTKIYNNGTFKIQKNSWYTLAGTPPVPHNGSMSDREKEDKTIQYLKQVKKDIYDLAINNQDKFHYFITLTFNISNSSYSHELVLNKLQNWLRVQRRNNPDMYYILVPELHPNSDIPRLHFHGLFGNVPSWTFTQATNFHTGDLIFTKYGSPVYNLDNYKLGFTTVSIIDRPEQVSNYISKYTTKDIISLSSLKNKKKYWYSRNLSKPRVFKTEFDGSVKSLEDKFDLFYYDVYTRDSSSVEVGSFCLY